MNRTGPDYIKLKASLELAINHLEILRLKKLKQNERLISETVICIKNSKYILARLRIRKILKDDAVAKVAELIEMHCRDTLLKYKLFQENRKPDECIITPISSLIWITPYYRAHVKELKVILFQLAYKYGVRFCIKILRNEFGTVDLELIHRVKMFSISNDQIENYLQSICVRHRLTFNSNENN